MYIPKWGLVSIVVVFLVLGTLVGLPVLPVLTMGLYCAIPIGIGYWFGVRRGVINKNTRGKPPLV